MNRRSAMVLASVGAVGSLSIASVIATAAVQGLHANDQPRFVTNCAPDHPRGSLVHVTLSDRGGAMMGGANAMMVALEAQPAVVTHGVVTFIATNTGALNHELLILRAPRDGVGTRPVQSNGKINERASLGEASRSCARGAGDGISPGTTSWVTRTLSAGTYEIVCDQPWHYANGMFQTFIVR